MSTPDFDPSELLDRISADPEGKARDAAVARINELAQGIKRRLDAGVAPAEYEVLSKVHAALEEAPSVVEGAWSILSKRKA